MMGKLTFVVLAIIGIVSWGNALAEGFADGPVIFGHGQHAPVNQDVILPKDTVFKLTFDIDQAGKEGTLNRGIDTVARFINMHVANGVPQENLHLAMVMHGSASNELLNAKAYKQKYGKPNPNAELLSTLVANGVQIMLCGQSAYYHQIDRDDLIDGVDMVLSAMTAHMLLNQKGYYVNPF
tara:strand:+ start:1074 stop:1616 length:543 start_codon:yes stop_codon:yes gene_type:complete